jgi:hypothetical protein
MAIIKKEQIINLVIEGAEGYRRRFFFSNKKGPCWKSELLVGTDIRDEECWNGIPPEWIVDANGKKLFQPNIDKPAHKIYFPSRFVREKKVDTLDPKTGKKMRIAVPKSASARKPIDRIVDPETRAHLRDENTGLYIARIDPHFKRAVAYFHEDNNTDIPNYWVVTDEVSMEKFLYYPYPCNELDNVISDPEMQRKLEVIQRYHKLQVLFTYCRGKVPKHPSENPKPYATLSGTLAIDKGLKKVDIDGESGYYPAGKIKKGEKNTLSKNIKVKFNSVIKSKFKEGGKYYDIFNKKSIPPIIFHEKFMDENIEMTNNKVFLQGSNYVDFGSDEAFIRKIFNRAAGKRYDESIINNIDLDGNPKQLYLSQISTDAVKRGEDVRERFSVKNDYGGPRKEGAILTVRLARENDPGIGQNNYFKGEIVAYDNKRNRITLKITDVVGTLSGDRWKVSYDDVHSYYVANQFSSGRRWSIDKGAQYVIDNEVEGGTKSKYEGLTPSYGIAKGGYTKGNPSTTLKLLWQINGERTDGQFTWKITLLLKYGKRTNDDAFGNVTFKEYTLNPDSIYNDGRLEQTEVVNLVPPDKSFDNLWVRAGSVGEEPITTEQFNQLSEREQDLYRRYCIMDDLNIYNGLIDLLDKFMGKVNSIDPQEALKLVDITQQAFGTELQETKRLVNKILSEIKKQK